MWGKGSGERERDGRQTGKGRKIKIDKEIEKEIENE